MQEAALNQIFRTGLLVDPFINPHRFGVLHQRTYSTRRFLDTKSSPQRSAVNHIALFQCRMKDFSIWPLLEPVFPFKLVAVRTVCLVKKSKKVNWKSTFEVTRGSHTRVF